MTRLRTRCAVRLRVLENEPLISPSQQIKSGFDAGSELVVTVLKSMGEEQVHAVKLGASIQGVAASPTSLTHIPGGEGK